MPKHKKARRKDREQRRQQQAAAAGPSWAQLPEDVLAALLARLPQHERLGAAALVCRAWSAAAIAASVHVLVPPVQHGDGALEREELVIGMWEWLARHGGHVQSLREEGADFDWKHLYVRLLVEDNGAVINDCISEDVTWRRPPTPLSLPRLTALHLLRCPCPFTAASLAAHTRLTELHVQRLMAPVSEWALSAALPALTRLRSLGACAQLQDAGVAACITRLPALQSLALDGATLVPAALALPLPAALTRLELRADRRHEHRPAPLPLPVLSAAATPSLAQLTALRDVRLAAVRLLPGLWRGLSQLTRFDALDVDLGDDEHGSSAAELLRLLGRQRGLAHLHLRGTLHYHVAHSDAGDGAPTALGGTLGVSPLYGALVASSLVSLVLDGCALPAGVGRVMFGAGMSLASLTRLEMRLPAPEPGLAAPEPYLAASDLGRIASAVGRRGALQVLTLSGVCAGPLVDVSCLRRLAGLSSLTLGRVRAEGLHCLRRLLRLGIEDEDDEAFELLDLADVALHLTRLTRLSLRGSCCTCLGTDVFADLGSTWSGVARDPVVTVVRAYGAPDSDCEPEWSDDSDDGGDAYWRARDAARRPLGSVRQQVEHALSRAKLWDGLVAKLRQRVRRRRGKGQGRS